MQALKSDPDLKQKHEEAGCRDAARGLLFTLSAEQLSNAAFWEDGFCFASENCNVPNSLPRNKDAPVPNTFPSVHFSYDSFIALK